jgi:hypothetical protein
LADSVADESSVLLKVLFAGYKSQGDMMGDFEGLRQERDYMPRQDKKLPIQACAQFFDEPEVLSSYQRSI